MYNLYDIAFYFFAFISIVSGAIVVFSRNIVHAAFSLLFTFFGVVGIYVLLNADFLAVTQLLVYVGGILMLLLFGVMLTNTSINIQIKSKAMQAVPATIIVAMTAGTLCGIFYITDWKTISEIPDATTTTYKIGEMFMTTYLLPFEIASIVMLVALIGAAMIARRDKPVQHMSSLN